MRYIFALIILVVIFAHVGAFNIFSADKEDISILVDANKFTWEKIRDDSIVSKVSSVKLSDNKILQVSPDSKLYISKDTDKNTVSYANKFSDRIEGYYSYGKSSAYPWGIYWCIHDLNGKPMIVFSEFSKRSVWFSPISSDKVGEITATLNKGELPDIILLQEAAGA